jgi:two-component system, NarL family, response regulator DevR
MDATNDGKKRPQGSFALSDRERECLELAASGFNDREIGNRLGLSEKTVDEYIQRVKHKFDVPSRVEAIVWALKLGLIKV